MQGHLWTARRQSRLHRKELEPDLAGRNRPADSAHLDQLARERLPVRPRPTPGNLVLQLRRDLRRRHAAAIRRAFGVGQDDRTAGAGSRREVQSLELGPHRMLSTPYAATERRDLIRLGQSGERFDSSLPSGAPPGSESRVDCFQQSLRIAAGRRPVPSFNYITLPNDHTQGLRREPARPAR